MLFHGPDEHIDNADATAMKKAESISELNVIPITSRPMMAEITHELGRKEDDERNVWLHDKISDNLDMIWLATDDNSEAQFSSAVFAKMEETAEACLDGQIDNADATATKDAESISELNVL